MEHSHTNSFPRCLWLLPCYNAELSRYTGDHGPQSLKGLLSGPLQKEFASPSSRTVALSPGCTLESLGDLF